MPFEWKLSTPKLKIFKVTTKHVVVEEVASVDEDGNPSISSEEKEVERTDELLKQANVIRVHSSANSRSTSQFHIRLIYGTHSILGVFEPAARDDGIVISGPNYHDLDTNKDGLISEKELLSMSAKILKWSGVMVEVTTLPVEGLAS